MAKQARVDWVMTSDQRRMIVIRPRQPSLALAVARVAVERQDAALFRRLPSEVGEYTFVGYLARVEGKLVLVDHDGAPAGELLPGDSFVSEDGIESTEAPSEKTGA